MDAEVGQEEEDEEEACPTMLRLSFTLEPGIAGQPCGEIGVILHLADIDISQLTDDEGLINICPTVIQHLPCSTGWRVNSSKYSSPVHLS